MILEVRIRPEKNASLRSAKWDEILQDFRSQYICCFNLKDVYENSDNNAIFHKLVYLCSCK
jgi:hypothetical protein